jgi:hypothetical protein
MRLAYLTTEKAPGGQLIIDAPSQYSVVLAHNHAKVVGSNASLATVKAYVQSVDPSIVNAV